MRQAVLQKRYEALYPILTPGEASRVSTSWPETYLSRVSLDKDGEQRGKLPDIEWRRGDLVVSVSVKNPQPCGSCFRVCDCQIHLIVTIDGELRHRHIERSHDRFQPLARGGVERDQGIGKICVAHDRKTLGTRYEDKRGDVPIHSCFGDCKLGIGGIRVWVDRLNPAINDTKIAHRTDENAVEGRAELELRKR